VLEKYGKGNLKVIYNELYTRGIDHVHVDVGGVNDMVKEVLRTVTDNRKATCEDGKDAAIQVVAAAKRRSKGKPILIHLDEVGAQPNKHDLYNLQLFVREVFAELWRVGNTGDGVIPIVFFFVTGKSTEYFFELGTKRVSPIQSTVLVLDMLSETHICEVCTYLRNCDKSPIILNGLATEELNNHLYVDYARSRVGHHVSCFTLYALFTIYVCTSMLF
jgi:hypothetical protein